MSSEVNVLFDGPLPSAAALTRTMKELGFPLAIKRGAGTLEQHKGFLPMRLRRQDSGVEFDTFNERSAIEEMAGADIDARFTRSANFRWGGDDNEMLTGMCAAAALAKLVNGLVLNEWDEHPIPAEQAIAQARETLQKTADREAHERRTPGTRPADIKRYLAPLLRERSDLALIGRRLVIRPVRHLLRGAYFDRTRDKYSFRIWQFVNPLYAGIRPDLIGYGRHVDEGAFAVWKPHFQPLLMTTLARDVFEPVGRITTLTDYAESYEPAGAQLISLLLAGERDRAAEFVRQIDEESRTRSGKPHPASAHWESIDIEALCARRHAAEAAAIKGMKLESIWEPSPFPVELPPAERARLAEPAFSTAPWINEPPDLFAEMPRHPGEFRFAKSFWRRNDVPMLLVPLTREAAEDRHNHLEDYILAAQLPNGLLFTLDRSTHWDRNQPQADAYPPDARFVSLNIALHGASEVAYLNASTGNGDPRRLEIWSATVNELRPHRSIWSCHISRTENRLAVRDERNRARSYETFDLNDEIRTLATIPMPEFGEYAELAARAQAMLRQLGYGEVALAHGRP